MCFMHLAYSSVLSLTKIVDIISLFKSSERLPLFLNNMSDQEIEQKENKSPQPLSAVPNYLQPQHTTPCAQSSQFKIAINPFESGLIERMKRPSFLSPNVLKMSTSAEGIECEWSIEDLSRIAPVPIEEDNTHSQCTETLDPEEESNIQEVIDKYFTKYHVIPSPCWKSPLEKYGTAASSTPQNKKSSTASVIEKCNVGCQTNLSFPVKLPSNIEELLKPYFQLEENNTMEEGDSLNSSNSRRKLKFSPAYTTMERSPVLSGKYVSPTHMSILPTTPIVKNRTIFSPAHIESPPTFSPIMNANSTATKMLIFTSSDSSSSSNYQTPSNSSVNESQEDISMILIETTQRSNNCELQKQDDFQDTGYSTNENNSSIINCSRNLSENLK